MAENVIAYAEPSMPSVGKSAPGGIASPRLDSLDLLRGASILGILLMNTQSMSMPSWAYFDPTYYHPGGGPIDTVNYLTWCVIHVLADVKLLTIFSMLFGAGIVIQSQRSAARGESPAGVHYRRMLGLLLIGLIHAYLIWYGDVLVSYVFCAVLLFPFRKLPPTLLLFIGVIFIVSVVYFRYAEEHSNSPVIARILETQYRIYGDSLNSDNELEVYRGSYADALEHRARLSLGNQSTWFVLWGFWRYGGCMLIGMGLFTMRFFHGEWTRQAYRTMAATLIPLGWSFSIAGILYHQTFEWDRMSIYYHGEHFNYLGSLVTAFGYLAFGVLFSKRAAEGAIFSRFLAAPLRAIGKTALSNYIMQGLICTTIFYGHGLGWFGYLTRVQLVGLVLCVWAFQMVVSMLWLKVFRQGPLEWGWHWLAHGSRQPH